MITPLWPESLFDLIFIPHIDEKLEELTSGIFEIYLVTRRKG